MPEDNQGFCSIVQDQHSVRSVGCSINNTSLRWWIRVGKKKSPPEDLLHNLVVSGKEQLWLVTLTMASFSSSVPVSHDLHNTGTLKPKPLIKFSRRVFYQSHLWFSSQTDLSSSGSGGGYESSLRGLATAVLPGRCCSNTIRNQMDHFRPLCLCLCHSPRERERERGGLWMVCITTCSRFVLLVIRNWWICAEGFMMSGFGRQLETSENNVW